MKIRLDQYLCQNGLAQSRERAKALIMAGIVYVGEEKSDKPGNMVEMHTWKYGAMISDM